MESPNTDTVKGRFGSRRAAGRAATGLPGGEGDTAATADTPGGRLPSGVPPGPPCTGTNSTVTATADARVAPASGNNGTRTGCHRRIGCSINHHDAAATATVAAQRAANSGAPDQPVRSPLSTRNIGQCQRYTP